MEEELETNNEEFDILDIPDDQIDEYIAKAQQQEETNNGLQETNEEDSSEEEVEASESVSDETEEESDTEVEEDTSEANTEPYSASESDSEDNTEEKLEETNNVDYKAEYEKLLAPFKANGKDMQVESVEDARTLMQMGANYNKKMAGLKPSLKIVKLLEQHNLLDEEKLSFLIDVNNKDPEAIKKLLKDSNVDPLELDMDELKYQPKRYQVSDKEVELDSVLEEIKDTPSFQTTANILGNKWDEASKKIVLDNPQLIKIINEHVQSGIYDQISSVVERERMLGRLIGLSDIEAYKTVGDAINARGGFNTQPQGISEPTSNIKANKVDPSVAQRKKAASSTKSKTVTKVQDDFNPLAMSDEEFERSFSNKFI